MNDRRITRDELEHVWGVASGTRGEALAAAVDQCGPGDRVEVHAKACGADRGEPCSCDGLAVVVARTRTI
jgi:hypothetical protein